MKRHFRPGSRAYVAFVVTVVLAFAASVMTLVPHQTTQVADSQVHSQLEQLVPAGVFD
ncbi:hypothetical protein [Diaphorobacter sp. LR2014-1]|uniref:hypothetical protein n=1 Tax=Diaphorobacter sp. LR2014-1 TaxID=1933219 RepID=UPI00155F353B|nr:hypothetical protein [Diaphorobacter sp. LR2014-1]